MNLKLSDGWKDYLPIALVVFLAAAWLLVREQFISYFCVPSSQCIFHPGDWPALLGVSASSSPVLIAIVIALLFALPIGRGGLLATLVAIHLGIPVLGLAAVVLVFLSASVVSVVGVYWLVERAFEKTFSEKIRKRLRFFEKLLAPSIKKHPVLALGLGNLAGSQWHMSALGVMCRVERKKALLGLMLGNIAGFILVFALGSVPDLDAVTIVLAIVSVTLVISTPALLSNLKKSF